LLKGFFSVFGTIANPFQAILNQAVLRWCGKCKVVLSHDKVILNKNDLHEDD